MIAWTMLRNPLKRRHNSMRWRNHSWSALLLAAILFAAALAWAPSPSSAQPAMPTPTVVPARDVSAKTQADVLAAEGANRFAAGDYAAALKAFDQAVLLYRQAGARPDEAGALVGL